MNASPNVDQALADLAMAAVARLSVEMNSARNSKDRIAAANSILDRLGYSRTARAQADVADQEIRNALEAVSRSRGREILASARKPEPEAQAQALEPEDQAQTPEPEPNAFTLLSPDGTMLN